MTLRSRRGAATAPWKFSVLASLVVWICGDPSARWVTQPARLKSRKAETATRRIA